MSVKKAKKPAGKAKDAFECRVCGYRVIVDETCGCAEEHIFICCGKPMAKAAGKTRKKTAKKTAKKAAKKS
jgi:hypothetical protein